MRSRLTRLQCCPTLALPGRRTRVGLGRRQGARCSQHGARPEEAPSLHDLSPLAIRYLTHACYIADAGDDELRFHRGSSGWVLPAAVCVERSADPAARQRSDRTQSRLDLPPQTPVYSRATVVYGTCQLICPVSSVRKMDGIPPAFSLARTRPVASRSTMPAPWPSPKGPPGRTYRHAAGTRRHRRWDARTASRGPHRRA